MADRTFSEAESPPLPQTLRTDRLLLRPFVRSDAAAIFSYSSDTDWRRFQQTSPETGNDAETIVEEFIARDRITNPAWALEHDGRTIGVTTLNFESQSQTAQVGYGIHEAYRGQGLVGEALRAVLRQAFVTHELLGRVVANTHAENQSSHRLLTKLGFSFESDVRVFAGELAVEGSIFGLIRSDWGITSMRSEADLEPGSGRDDLQ
jgi:ribosomal-protein-alanine N-acetyltransferase